jgi:hypothetical protein
MPYREVREHRQGFNPLMDANHIAIEQSRLFDSSYLVANSYGEKWLYGGMIVSVDSSTEKWVPYSSIAAYGTGSDAARGVTIEPMQEMTYGDGGIAPLWHGKVREQFCWVYGGAMGTVPDAVKTALDDILWV